MNALSNEFHTILDGIKEEGEKVWQNIEAGAATELQTLQTVVANLLDQAGPLVLQAAAAAASAALSGGGSIAAMAAAAETAAVSTLKSGGVTLADTALAALKVAVVGNLAKPAGATASAAPAATH